MWAHLFKFIWFDLIRIDCDFSIWLCEHIWVLSLIFTVRFNAITAIRKLYGYAKTAQFDWRWVINRC